MKTRSLALPVLALLAALSSACTTMSPQPASTLPYYLGFQHIEAQHDNLDRYACMSGRPLACECSSLRLAGTCSCSCPQ